MISEKAAEIFLEARTLTPETQADYLAAACGDDNALRSEVESMLTAANESEAYFDELAGRVGMSALAKDGDLPVPVGKVVGSWRILDRIGSGGMGVVYLAERADGQYEQRAALKILPTGLASDQARARFLIERQILARLVHENIARLLDGGVTDDGVPYFVMDYVEGLPIDDYCRNNQLGTREVLALVLDIARAVQFAHRNLVIHRDLKPNNVLVDEQGRVSLLDFGIAKVLTDGARDQKLTQASRRPATPAYASPEMLRGDAVDVTTDVYSIGALTYVLLTGRMPLDYEGLNHAELYARAEVTVPDPVSRHNSSVERDIDAIVAKALAKHPEERYASVESLANDIHRYLDGLPVAASVPSPWYRGRKFVARHRVGVAFAVFAVTALTSIAGLAVRSAIVSERQAEQIALERDHAEQTKEFLVSIFDAADPNIAPGEQTARAILESGKARIEEELAGQPEVQADLLRSIGSVYRSWRLPEEGRAVLEQELELRGKSDGVESAAYVDTLIELAVITDISGDYDASLEYAETALRISTGIADGMGQANAHERIGRIHHLRGDLDTAQEHFDAALELIVAEKGEDAEEVSYITEHLANLYLHQERSEEAIAEFRRTLELREKHFQGDHSAISPLYLGLGNAFESVGRLDEATLALHTGLEMNNRLYGEDNSYSMYFENALGKVAELRDDLTVAATHYEQARQLILLHTPESPNLAFASANVGKVFFLRGEYEQALPLYRESASVFEDKLPGHWAFGDVKWRLGACLAESGQFAEAEPWILEGIDIIESRWGPDHEATRNARSAAVRLYEAWGQPGKTAAFLQE